MINENSILITMNPVYLIICGVIFCFAGYICARIFRDTNDFSGSVKVYLPTGLLLAVICHMLLHVDVILVICLYICGFIAMAIISNYFF